MPDLVAFLLARIAEDEALARAASASQWTPEDKGVTFLWKADDFHEGEAQARLEANTWDNVDHITRWSPARVLAECAIKRRIVGEHLDLNADWQDGSGDVPSVCARCEDRDAHDAHAWPCPTLLLLALPYVDHPHYDEAWRP